MLLRDVQILEDLLGFLPYPWAATAFSFYFTLQAAEFLTSHCNLLMGFEWVLDVSDEVDNRLTITGRYFLRQDSCMFLLFVCAKVYRNHRWGVSWEYS